MEYLFITQGGFAYNLIKSKDMKKILFGIAMVICMVMATSCWNQKKTVVEEEEVCAAAVDSVEVAPADTLEVVAE